MLRLIGAGLPRTGTTSLKYALATLLGERCYHFSEMLMNPGDVPLWRDAVAGNPDWPTLFDGCAAAVDWPASAFWPELAQAYPNAVILLSTRADAAAWWKSMDATVMGTYRNPIGRVTPGAREMSEGLWLRAFGEEYFDDAGRAQVAYDRYVQRVRDTAPAGRLLEWSAADGWGPLCAALDVPVPDEPFPHLNTSADWAERRAQAVDQLSR